MRLLRLRNWITIGCKRPLNGFSNGYPFFRISGLDIGGQWLSEGIGWGKNKLIDIGLRWISLDIERVTGRLFQDIGWSCEVANPRQST
jgi:hypothetical protein